MDVTDYDGKTIDRTEVYETYVLIYFTDGTIMEISSHGSEFSWITVEKG